MRAEGFLHQTDDDLEDRLPIQEAYIGLLRMDIDVNIRCWYGEE